MRTASFPLLSFFATVIAFMLSVPIYGGRYGAMLLFSIYRKIKLYYDRKGEEVPALLL